MYQFTSIHDHISFKELSKIWMYISSRKQGYFHAVWRLPFHQPQLYLKNLINMAFLVAQMVRICLQSRRPGFDPWVRKIPWRREWQPTPVFLPGESHGQKSLVGYSLWVTKSQTQLSSGHCAVLCCAVVQSPSLSSSLGPHGLQHTRRPCSPPPPRVCPRSCLSPWWCCRAISSSDTHTDTHVHVHTCAWPPESSKVYVLWKEELTLAQPCSCAERPLARLRAWRGVHAPAGAREAVQLQGGRSSRQTRSR